MFSDTWIQSPTLICIYIYILNPQHIYCTSSNKAFFQCKCSEPPVFCCSSIRYFVGCNNLGQFPFPLYDTYYPDAWRPRNFRCTGIPRCGPKWYRCGPGNIPYMFEKQRLTCLTKWSLIYHVRFTSTSFCWWNDLNRRLNEWSCSQVPIHQTSPCNIKKSWVSIAKRQGIQTYSTNWIKVTVVMVLNKNKKKQNCQLYSFPPYSIN